MHESIISHIRSENEKHQFKKIKRSDFISSKKINKTKPIKLEKIKKVKVIDNKPEWLFK